jgi:hypothetical protein
MRRRYREEINRYLHPWDGDLGWISQISPDLLRHAGLEQYFARQAAAMQTNNPPQSEEERIEARKAFIERSLLSKKVIVAQALPPPAEAEPEIVVEPSPIDQDNKTKAGTKTPMEALQAKSDLVIRKVQGDTPGDEDENTCAICWMEYQDDEDICYSQNAECGHVFHRDCIQEWLIQHDECPCCRNNYLLTQQDSDSNENTDVVPPISRESEGTTQQPPNALSLLDFVLLMQQMYYNSHHNLFYANELDEERGIEIGPAIEDYGLTGPAPIISATTIPIGMENINLDIPGGTDDGGSQSEDLASRIERLSEQDDQEEASSGGSDEENLADAVDEDVSAGERN